jgi:hypothetical protein
MDSKRRQIMDNNSVIDFTDRHHYNLFAQLCSSMPTSSAPTDGGCETKTTAQRPIDFSLRCPGNASSIHSLSRSPVHTPFIWEGQGAMIYQQGVEGQVDPQGSREVVEEQGALKQIQISGFERPTATSSAP